MAYEDLLKDSSYPLDNKNYFNLTITDLSISASYPLQFRWKYEDGSFGPWSAVKGIASPAESFPNVPSNLTVTGGAGLLTITWDGNNSTGSALTNFDRVDVYINGLASGNVSKPADSFFAAGTKTVVAPAGVYIISSYAVSKAGTLSAMSAPITRTVTSVSQPVVAPEDPFVPTITAGLAEIIVSWNGKKSDGISNFTTGAFDGAKVYIGTSSGFIPSSDNWVHSLNFANGTNQVSIGVGTVIDKTSGAKLAYGTPYYIKIRTINAAVPPVETSTAIASSPTNVTVEKLPASEISTGILTAGNSITAGVSGGQRVVMSGSVAPLIIYGTDGTTELLKYVTSGTTGSLSIQGSGTFSGNISAATGTLTNALNIGTPSSGLYPFSVSSSGILRAVAGEIGGWTLSDQSLYKGSNFQINGNDGIIYVGPSGGLHLRISQSGIASYNGGSANGVLNLATNGNIAATTGTFGGSLSGATGTFSGSLSAATGSFTGSISTSNISATGGTVGGWTLDSGYMYGSDTQFYPTTSPGGNANTYALLTSRSIGATKFAATSSGTDAITATGGITVLGNYATNTGNFTTTSGNFLTLQGTFTAGAGQQIVLYADGRIYANTLGTTTGTPNIRQDASGYLRYTSSSSERYKNSIVDIKNVNSLDPYKLLEIPVRAFKYNSGYVPDTDQRFNTLVPGFIAEEVEEFYPIAVDYNNENKPENWVPNYIIPGMLVLIKDLNTRLDALEG